MENEGLKKNSGALFVFIHAPGCFLVFPWGFFFFGEIKSLCIVDCLSKMVNRFVC